jgi:hypothetical protein
MNKTITIALLITITTPVASFARYEAVAEDNTGGNYTAGSSGSSDSKPTTKSPDSSHKYSGEFDSTCIINSLQLREDALADAFSRFAIAKTRNDALRKAGLISALEKPTARERADARKAVWAEFRAKTRADTTKLKTERQKIWSTYKSSMGTCKGGRAELSGDVASGSSVESQ